MKVDLLTLCQSAHETPEGQLTITNAIVRYGVEAVPATFQCTLVTRLRFDAAEEGEHAFATRILDPDGNPATQSPPTKIQCRMLPDESFGYCTLTAALNFTLPCYGEYFIVLTVDEEETTYQFHVKKWPPTGR